MFRKSILALAAAGTLALGMTSMTNTASAEVRFGIGFGTGYDYAYHPGFYHRHGWRHHFIGPRCFIETVRVRRHHRWVLRNVRVCRGYPGY